MILEFFNRIFFFKRTSKVNCWQGMAQFENERGFTVSLTERTGAQCHSHDCLWTLVH